MSENTKPKTDKYVYVVFKEGTYEDVATFTSKTAWADWISEHQSGFKTVKVKIS